MRRNINFLKTLTDTFSISEDTAIGGLIAAALLLLFALGVVVHVFLVSHERKISFRSAMKYAFSALWAVPVLAVLACFGLRAADYFQTAKRQAETVQQRGADDPEATDSRVEPLFTPGKEAPEWTNIRQPTADEVITAVPAESNVIVARGASVGEAEQKLAAIARNRLASRIENSQRRADESSMLAHASDDAIKAYAVNDRFEQPGIEKVRVTRPGGTDKEYSNKVYQVYWKLESSNEALANIRQEASIPRLWLLGGLVGLLTMIAAAVAIYLRLDANTQGKYRLRLKMATTSFLVAAGLLLTALLPIG